MKKRRISRWIGCAAALCAAAPGPANASSWSLQLMGVKALGVSYAGVAANPEDASAVWFNPAGMPELGDGWTVTAGSPFVQLGLDWRDAGTTSLLGQPMRGDATADGGQLVVIPHLYVVRRMGERWWAGFGFNAPFGLGTRYGKDWVGRYHADETTLQVFNLNPSIGVRVNDQLSLGAGLDLQLATGVFSESIDFGSIGAASGLPLTPQGHDGGVRIEGDDTAISWNVGLLWTPREATRIGVAYRAGTTQSLEGEADFTVPPEAEPLTGGGVIFVDTRATAPLPMPASLEVGLVQAIGDDWKLLAGVGWTDWSREQAVRITFENPAQPTVVQETKWSDTMRYSLGASRRAGARWVLRGGVAYEESPVPDSTRDPRIPEAAHRWFGVGATWQQSERLSVDLLLNHLLTDRADMTVADPTAGTLRGEVDWSITSLGVAGTYRF